MLFSAAILAPIAVSAAARPVYCNSRTNIAHQEDLYDDAVGSADAIVSKTLFSDRTLHSVLMSTGACIRLPGCCLRPLFMSDSV